MRSLFLVALLAGSGLASPVAAQEGAGALSAPIARDGSRPAAPAGDASRPAAPAGDATANAAADADALGDVPPPPGQGYGTPRYEAPDMPTGRVGAVRADAPDLRIPSRIATRLRVLEGSLQSLASRGGSSVVDGALSLLSGGLSISLGIWVKKDARDDLLSTYLFLWGGANIARGVIDLALMPNASRPAIAFTHMPMGSMEEVESRLRFGEDALEELARRTKLARVLDASLNIAVGAAVVPLYLGPNDFTIDDPFDYFVIIGSGISVITGIINLASRSAAERRWAAYEELRDRLVAESASAPRIEFLGAAVAPRRGGAMLNLGARF